MFIKYTLYAYYTIILVKDYKHICLVNIAFKGETSESVAASANAPNRNYCPLTISRYRSHTISQEVIIEMFKIWTTYSSLTISPKR